MLIVIAIVGGSIFTTVQGANNINSEGFESGDLDLQDTGLSSENLQMEVRAASLDQVQIDKVTVGSEDGEEVVNNEDKIIPAGETARLDSIGVADSNTVNELNVEVEYSTGALDNVVAEGSLSGNIDVNTEEAAPGNGEWEFVDVSEVNQSTVDTSGMSDFYIMKYEASRKGNASSGLNYEPVSRENHVPWASISQNEAINKCQGIGANLPSNKQWQAATMAEIGNSSSQPLGNTENNEDSTGTQGTIDPTSPDWNNDGEPDRTLTGSGPESWANSIGVYDLNGNVWERTSTTVSSRSDPLHSAEPKDGNGNNHVDSWDASIAGPDSLSSSGNSDFGNDFYWTNPGWDENNDADRAVRRGGHAYNGADAGVFSMTLLTAPSFSDRNLGFRCSFS